jgi:hypothetical protein
MTPDSTVHPGASQLPNFKIYHWLPSAVVWYHTSWLYLIQLSPADHIYSSYLQLISSNPAISSCSGLHQLPAPFQRCQVHGFQLAVIPVALTALHSSSWMSLSSSGCVATALLLPVCTAQMQLSCMLRWCLHILTGHWSCIQRVWCCPFQLPLQL